MSDVPGEKLTGLTHYPILITGNYQTRHSSGDAWVLTRCRGVYSVLEAEIDEENPTCLECIAIGLT